MLINIYVNICALDAYLKVKYKVIEKLNFKTLDMLGNFRKICVSISVVANARQKNSLLKQ